MGRVFKIATSALVLALLFLWIVTLVKSCGNETAQAEADIESAVDELPGEMGDDYTDLSSDDFEDEFEGEEEDDLSSTDESPSGEDEISYEDLDQELDNVSDLTEPIEETVETPQPKRQAKPEPSTSSVSSNPNAGFLLVAGSYSIHTNAEQMRSKLKRMGYDSAEIVQFDDSSFSTVVASRFNSYESALNEASNLKSRGIDCYVHRKKD